MEELAVSLDLTEVQTELLRKARHASQVRHEGAMTAETACWPVNETIALHESPGAAIEADEEWNELRMRMNRLDSRERKIVSLRFGLGGEPPLTLHEIAERLGLNKEWIRKLTTKAIRKLDDSRHGVSVHGQVARGGSYDFDGRSRPFRDGTGSSRALRDHERREPVEPSRDRTSPRPRV
jgi:DNA-directed RNA polymerase sigma subunit (sigma70/sigma32)